MGRRSKGFTMTELLTALMIHSFFILMLGGTFYTLISFGSRSQMVMTARERGQRVIGYIDSRVRNAGLGMWKLESSEEIRKALGPLAGKVGSFEGALYNKDKLPLPVAVTYYYDNDSIVADHDDIVKIKIKKKSDGTYYGNILTILYAQRETGTYHEPGGEDDIDLILNVRRFSFDIPAYTDDELRNLIGYIDSDDFWIDFFTKKFTESSDPLRYLNRYKDYKNSHSSEINLIENAAYDIFKNQKPTDPDKAIEKITEHIFDDYRIMINSLAQYYPVRYKYINNNNCSKGEFYYSEFGKKKETNDRVENNDHLDNNDIREWGVSRGTGVPFLVDRYDDIDGYEGKYKYLVKLTPLTDSSDTIPDGDELLYLKCVRLFATAPTDYDTKHGQPLRNFSVQKLDGEKWRTNGGSVNPYQQGILELYAELDKNTSILSVWVLSTGGKDNMTHERPKEWPTNARPKDWDKSDYKHHVVYVSKGTWKLNNLSKDFEWN